VQITITNLNKTYSNGAQALKDISLTINQGMFRLLGPNGAGKSSLMRTIATLQWADSGSISLGDINVLTQKEDVHKTLGYLPQEFGVYPKIDAVTLLNHLAVLKGITNASERKNLVESLLQKTNLWDSRKKNLGDFQMEWNNVLALPKLWQIQNSSSWMNQRLDLTLPKEIVFWIYCLN